MMETEILQLTGFGSKAAEKNLPVSLNAARDVEEEEY